MKKVGYFFFCFLPLFATIGLQFVISFPIMGLCMIKICFMAILSGTKMDYINLMTHLSDLFREQNFSMVVSLAYAVAGVLLFGLWYLKQFDGDLRFPTKQFTNPKLVLGIIFLVPGLQVASSILTALSASLFPSWMDFYEKLMESAGLTQSPSLLLFLYAVLLGPIAEELTFRGIVLSSAKKALPFWAANLFQAILFGIFHLNVIQGIYAFFIGLFLGYVCNRGGSIWLSMFLHILFNLWGVLVPSEFYSILFLLLSVVIGIAGLCLFYKNSSKASVNHSSYFSDM